MNVSKKAIREIVALRKAGYSLDFKSQGTLRGGLDLCRAAKGLKEVVIYAHGSVQNLRLALQAEIDEDAQTDLETETYFEYVSNEFWTAIGAK